MESSFLKKENGIFCGSPVKYWLYIPDNARENMPLIVYLHGGSGKGDDLDLLIENEGFPHYIHRKILNAPAYIVMPQAPESIRGWDEMNDEIIELINNTIDRFKIDRKNVSLTGHSMGGIGTWLVGCHNKTVFSRIAPLSGTVSRRLRQFPERVTLPVWSLVGSDFSDARAYDSNTEFFPQLTKLNQSAKLTVMQGYGHREVVRAYLEHDIIGWLINS